MTPQEQTQFAKDMLDAVNVAIPVVTAPLAQRLIVAHGAFESGWGKCNAFKRGFNAFNITAGSNWIAAGKPWWTDHGGDTDANGKSIDQNWRAYSSLSEALADYWSVLGWPKWLPARAQLLKAQPSVYLFAARLKDGAYFEAPLDFYAKGLQGAFDTVQKLLPVAVPPPTPTPK